MGISKEQFEQMQAKVSKAIGVAPAVPNEPQRRPFLDLTIQPSKDEDGLNKTERAYLAYLRCLNYPCIGIQNVTLKLADDTRYTPDFNYVDPNHQLIMVEVKGFMRDDAAVKLKVAARSFPQLRFVLVTKDKNGWHHTNINP